jgi:hypothetical protein
LSRGQIEEGRFQKADCRLKKAVSFEQRAGGKSEEERSKRKEVRGKK